MGQVNKITEEEAKEAAFVIVASDRKNSRNGAVFEGKPVN